MNAIDPGAARNAHLLRLSALLHLAQRAREAPAPELGFLIVNETAAIVPYHQAALWRTEGGALILSGAGSADPDGPYAVWLKKLFAALARAGVKHRSDEDAPGHSADHPRPRVIAEVGAPPALAAEWRAWLPSYALLCPLPHPGGGLAGMLLFARADPWEPGEIALLDTLTAGYAQCLVLAGLPRRRARPLLAVSRAKLAMAALLLAAIGIGLYPARSSVLAPAEIVPIDPAPIRAPFAGVVDRIFVAPNAPVRAGDKLLALDPSQVRSRVEVARKALEMAQVEYAQVSQEALGDGRVRNRLALLKSKIDQQAAELAYQETLLSRAEVEAKTDGVAIFNDSSEWVGKPVEPGERVMMIASPTSVELEMHVPVAEISTFDRGAEVLFFSNIAPDHPAAARLSFTSYGSTPGPDGVLAYVFRARFDNKSGDLRLGLRGTAKVFGARRPLALWLLRRPLAVLRLWLTP